MNFDKHQAGKVVEHYRYLLGKYWDNNPKNNYIINYIILAPEEAHQAQFLEAF